MKRYLLFVVCLMFLSLWAQAEDDVAPDVVPVQFATSTVKPWGINRSDAPDGGLLVEVMNALALETGVPVTNKLLPYPRVIHELFAGRADFAVLFDSPESRAEAIRVGHVVNARVLIVGSSDNSQVSSMEDLRGKRVGHIRGSKYGPNFDNNNDFYRIPINTMAQGLMMLIRGRLDAMAGTDQAFYWTINEMNVGVEKFQKLFVVTGATGALYMSKRSRREELLPEYQQALESLRAKGVLADIFNEAHEWSAPDN